MMLAPSRRPPAWRHLRHAAIAACALCGAGAAVPAWAAQSSAYAVSADLTTDGVHVQLPPLLRTSGETAFGQDYHQPSSAPLLLRAVRLLPKAAQSPVLTVVEQKAATDASGSNLVDALSAAATSSSAFGVVSLAVLPPGHAAVDARASGAASASTTGSGAGNDAGQARAYLLPALRIAFDRLEASASYNQVFRAPSHRSGSTRFADVTLSGPLVGPKPVRVHGDVAPNTVVVNTPSVKITLNAQTISQQPVCKAAAGCPEIPETIETQAVLVQLNHAAVHGRDVSGQIVIGDAQAGQ